ncbi:MAG: DUF192 domain-containing protein [Bdellovibrionia bacterium]
MKTLVVLSMIFATVQVWAVDFEVKKIKVGGKTLSVEVADNEERRQQGLMNRKVLDDGKGMIFIFGGESPQSFWMKNTLIPLSIAFFDSKKKLVDMFDMEPEASEMVANPRIYRSNKLSQYALEVPKGWFKENKIKVGQSFEFLDDSKKKSNHK